MLDAVIFLLFCVYCLLCLCLNVFFFVCFVLFAGTVILLVTDSDFSLSKNGHQDEFM